MAILSRLSHTLGGGRRRPTIGANYGRSGGLGRSAGYGRRRSRGMGGALMGTLGGLALREISRRGGGANRGRGDGAYGRPSGGLGGFGGLGAGRSARRGGGMLGGLLGSAMSSRGRGGRRTSGGGF